MKKRFIILVLCFSLVAGCFMLESSAKYFTDVTTTSDYLDAINYVSDNGYMGGTSSTEFSPTTAINRASFATVLYRYAGEPFVSGTEPFTDVASTAWYYDAVLWAYKNGYMGGTSSTTFSPTSNISRQDAAVVFYRYAGVSNYSNHSLLLTFNDSSDISDYAETAAVWSVDNDILFLTSRRFNPSISLKRQDMAKAIVNYGIKVKKFDVNTEGFGFENSKLAFFGDASALGDYYISNTHINSLMVKLQNSSAENQAAIPYVLDILQYVDDNGYWAGSCFGMSAVCGLDKLGKIDFNKNFPDNTDSLNMNSVESPKDSLGVQSGINYYHILQCVPSILHTQYLSASLSTVINEIKDESLFILGLDKSTISGSVGHAILVYKVEQTEYDNVYSIYAYDPNYPDVITVLRAYLNYGVILYYDTIGEIEYNLSSNEYDVFTVYKDWTGYDEFDIDGEYNTESGRINANTANNATDPVQLSSSVLSTNYTAVYFSDNANITITNDLGKKLIFSNGVISGDIEIYDKNICYLGANGKEHVIYIPDSSKFIFSFESEDILSFRVLKNDDYFSYTGEGSGILKYEPDNIDITGNIKKFDISMRGDGTTILHRLSGTNETSVTLCRTNSSITSIGFKNNISTSSITADSYALTE